MPKYTPNGVHETQEEASSIPMVIACHENQPICSFAEQRVFALWSLFRRSNISSYDLLG